MFITFEFNETGVQSITRETDQQTPPVNSTQSSYLHICLNTEKFFTDNSNSLEKLTFTQKSNIELLGSFIMADRKRENDVENTLVSFGQLQ